ncbi:MAG: hypothetical protein ABI977_14255 [Acidobacteriota bacterium]
MKDQQWQQQERLPEQLAKPLGDPLQTGPLEGDVSYPAAIEKMSDKWREVQKQERQEGPPRNFIERNSLALGIGLALLIVALLIVIGGFAFLVWNAR